MTSCLISEEVPESEWQTVGGRKGEQSKSKTGKVVSNDKKSTKKQGDARSDKRGKPPTPHSTPQKVVHNATIPSKASPQPPPSVFTSPMNAMKKDSISESISKLTITEASGQVSNHHPSTTLPQTYPTPTPEIPKKTPRPLEPISAFQFFQSWRDAETTTQLKKPNCQGIPLLGFLNTGNTCYRNAILQSLLSVPAMSNILFEVSSRYDDNVSVCMPDGLSSWKQFMALVSSLQNAVSAIESSPAPSSSSSSTSSSSSSSPYTLSSSFRRNVTAISPDDFLLPLFNEFEQKHGNVKISNKQLSTETSSSISTSSSSSSSSSSTITTKSTANTRQQQDAQEFLVFLLDSLHEEAAGYDVQVETSTDDAIQELQGWETVAKGKMKAVVDDVSLTDSVRKTASSGISRLFHGSMRSEVVYSKKKLSSTTFQRFACLCLDMKESNTFVSGGGKTPWGKGVERGGGGSPVKVNTKMNTLQECLLQQLQEEDLGGGMKKKLMFDVLPSVLVLQLKRFAFDHSRNTPFKINSAVEYQSTLAIPQALLSQDCITRMGLASSGRTPPPASNVPSPSEDVMYELTSVVCHHGATATSGHYTAFCKDPNDHVWKHVDDDVVIAATETEALQMQKEAYIFFYSRKSNVVSK